MRRPSSARAASIGVTLTKLAVEKELDWLFREQPTEDYGIDAQVEIVEGEAVSGKLLALQIKSGPSCFKQAGPGGWWFRPDAAHVRYWTNHSLPVVVLVHPENRTLLLAARQPGDACPDAQRRLEAARARGAAARRQRAGSTTKPTTSTAITRAVVGAETLCHQAMLMSHAACAVGSLNPDPVRVGDVAGQPAQRRGLLQGSVRPVGVVEVLILPQHGHKVALVPYQAPVEQFAAAAADPPFHDRVHSGRLDGGADDPGPSRRGAGSIPAFMRISQTVDGATVMPSPASSPWIRR